MNLHVPLIRPIPNLTMAMHKRKFVPNPISLGGGQISDVRGKRPASADFGRIGRTRPPGEFIRTFTIITTDANELVAEIYDHMPPIIPQVTTPAGSATSQIRAT